MADGFAVFQYLMQASRSAVALRRVNRFKMGLVKHEALGYLLVQNLLMKVLMKGA